MDILSGILTALMIVAGSYFVGLVIPTRHDAESVSLTMLSGLMVIFAIFEVVCEYCIFTDQTYDFLNLAFFAPVGILAVIGLIVGFKRILRTVKSHFSNVSPAVLTILPFIAMIVFETFMITRYMHVDDDDAFYVGTATTGVETNSLFEYDAYTGEPLGVLPIRYVLSPFFFFYGTFARLFNMPTAIVAHTLIPLILLPITFLVYWLWARELFPEKLQYRSLFMTFVTILFCFGYFSSYSATAFSLIRLWQGKAVLCSIGIPFLLYILYRIYDEGVTVGKTILLVATTTACCMMSTMGVAMGAIMVGIGWLLRLMHGRKPVDLLVLIGEVPPVAIGIIYLLMR